ncbi:hypothetical protein LHYA1_G000857 [Lachnellula hyalina]|uniref:Meiotic recombination protein DMC1 n=1 Tax=Lachnellula hyalina TaxID=1316788 RepID=A0A8H8R720_9HELO|nr:uncharacterized protein LHYA1_G000857 [Lachnellula hyalina]TVY29644.1 hypothetical protein LHYA1_G000857 [Lachnellula hyalina]
MDNTTIESGGFFPPSLPSPAPSNTSISSTTSNLPHPRAHPLRAGSAKEDAARRYIESRLLHVSRRYTKKFQLLEEAEEVHGYESMSEVAKDLGDVVDVLWISGTPSLQIPYLLNVAGSVTSYLPAFPPSPTATFKLLRKLDHAFASLIKGEDSETGESLPGFEAGKRAGMSRTDMVRCKSLVESTRVLIVEVMSRDPEIEKDTPEQSDMETDAMSVDENDHGDGVEDEHDMDVARVYEGTIVQLGEILGDAFGLKS